MNVALTRAKFVLVIVGNGDTLSSNEIWGKLLNHLINKGSYYKLSKSEDMDTFAEIMFRNTNDIPSIYKKTNLIFPLRTLKKCKVGQNEGRPKLFEEKFAKKSYKHNFSKNGENENKNFNDINAVLIEDNEQYEEKSETSKMGEGDDIDILAQEDHSYLFKNNEQKSNLMCLITKKAEMSEEQCVNSVFNLFDIANKIQK